MRSYFHRVLGPVFVVFLLFGLSGCSVVGSWLDEREAASDPFGYRDSGAFEQTLPMEERSSVEESAANYIAFKPALEEALISVGVSEYVSPRESGIYPDSYQECTPDGERYGLEVYVDMREVEGQFDRWAVINAAGEALAPYGFTYMTTEEDAETGRLDGTYANVKDGGLVYITAYRDRIYWDASLACRLPSGDTQNHDGLPWPEGQGAQGPWPTDDGTQFGSAGQSGE